MGISKRSAQRYYSDMSEFINRLDKECPDFVSDYDNNITLTGLAYEMSKLAKTYHRIQENACNYELSKWQLGRERNIEKRITEIVTFLKLAGVYFNGDPRGCPVILQLPSGYSNDFGNRGYCVPIWSMYY